MSQVPGSTPTSRSLMRDWRNYVRWTITAVLLIGFGFVGWTGYKLWSAWQSVERIDFALTEARDVLSRPLPPPVLEQPADDLLWDPPDGAFKAYLVVGTDEGIAKEVAAADSLTLFLVPARDPPILVSLPRDLLVTSPCDGDLDRIAETFSACDGIGAAEVLALAVEGYTGITVDHFAVFTFEGFVEVVDEVGGLELCLERDFHYVGFADDPFLEEGCQVVDGATALIWVRTRAAFERVDGEWVPAEGGDEGRRGRQQQFLLAMLAELRQFRSVGDLADLAGDLADSFALDARLSLIDAVSQVWDLRELDPNAIVRPDIATTPTATDDGFFGAMPVRSFAEELIAVYPAAAAFYR